MRPSSISFSIHPEVGVKDTVHRARPDVSDRRSCRVAASFNYAIKRIAEQALRRSQTVVPQRLNAALGIKNNPLAMQ